MGDSLIDTKRCDWLSIEPCGTPKYIEWGLERTPLVCQISFEPYDRCRDRGSAIAIAIAIASATASVSVDDSDSYIEGEIFILRRISSNCRRLLQGVYKLKLNAWIYYKP